MPECNPGGSAAIYNAEMAEIIVMRAYVRLPLMRRQADGCWIASLKRLGDCELRLVEHVRETVGEPVLRVEMFDRRTQWVVRVATARRSKMPWSPSKK